MRRDSIDFANEPVRKLFGQLLLPTLLGMMSIVVLNITDGAFVGRGVGANGLASVNIAAPIFTFITGLGMMLGCGCSIVASIHLSKENTKAARINVTQAFLATLVISTLLAILILAKLDATARLFGSSDLLVEGVKSYLWPIALFIPLNMLGIVGEYVLRLDGSPRVAMACTMTASFLNIFLDWLFIFPFGWGVHGAAWATGISFAISGLMVAAYMVFFSGTLKLYKLKSSITSIKLTVRNIGYQCKLGFSTMLGEFAVSCFMITGNNIFIKYMGEDGVAAFSVGCYCIPVAFMLANSITQASQPIISYAYGAGDRQKMLRARNVSLMSGLIAGLAGFATLLFGAEPITSIFLDKSEHAHELCTAGMPYFSIAALFICLNVVLIGYVQSIEQATRATVFTLLRGFILVIPCFILLPKLFGTDGLWLALPVAEALTTLAFLASSKRVKFLQK